MRSTQPSASPSPSPSQSQSSARTSKSKSRSKKARVSDVGGTENGADASVAAAATGAETGAPALPAAAAVASPLSGRALLASLPHAVSRRHPLAFHRCLRHALPSLHPSSAAISTVASPALPSRSPRLRHAMASAEGAAVESAGAAAAFLTQPLSEPTLGIRSLLFVRTRPLLVANSADCVFVWRGPDALRETDEREGASESKAPAAAAWSCAAILPVAALPAPATSVNQPSAVAGDLPCPFASCRRYDATRLPRQPSLLRSPSSSDGPVAVAVAPPAVFVCLSRDESALYIAVNRQVPCGGLGGGAQNASAIAGAAMPSPASAHGADSQSPWLSALLHSPAPRSSPGHGHSQGAPSASPRVAPSSSPRAPQQKGSPAPVAGGGSQGIETAFDALFANMDDESTPTASATTSMTQQLPPKEASSIAAPAGASAAATQPLPQQRSGRKPKRKFTGPSGAAALSMPAFVPMRASFEVYELRLAALDDAPVPAPSPAQSPISTRAKAAQSPTPAAFSSGADDDVDMMMADLLGQVNKHIASPPPRTQDKSAATDACDHLRLLLTSAVAVTAISSFGAGGLLVGDADGNVGVWMRDDGDTSASNAWKLQRTLASPRVSAIVSLSFAHATNEEHIAHPQPQVLVSVHRNADVQVWDVERGVRVCAIGASVHTQPAPPVPLFDSQAQGADRDSRGHFVVSPTTSTPSSASPLHRSNSSQHTPLTPLGADSGSLLIPETPSREVASSLSETFLSPPPRQENGERPLDAVVAGAEGGLDASVCVHAASSVVVDERSSQLQLLLLVSAPLSLGFHASAAVSGMASPSQQPAPRKSSRKRGATVVPTTYPPLPCPAALPSVVSLRLDLSDSARTAPLLDTRSFPVPLLLSDDNPSVHATCIGSSSMLAEQVAEKRRLLSSVCSDHDAPLPVPMLACGLSSGALLLHSASTCRLLAIMSDGGGEAEESLGGSQMQLSEHDDSAAGAGSRAVCEGYEAGAVTFASAYDEGAWTVGPHLSASPASAAALSSPAPSSSQRSPRARTTAAAGRARRGPGSLSSSPPPSSASRAGEERGGSSIGGSSSSCPSTLASSSSKHVCMRSITALAFHPLFHSLLAVGDQQGHVHVYTTTE